MSYGTILKLSFFTSALCLSSELKAATVFADDFISSTINNFGNPAVGGNSGNQLAFGQ